MLKADDFKDRSTVNTLPAPNPVREKKNSGVLLVFDEEKINEFKKIYGYEVQDQEKAKVIEAAPNMKEPTEIEDNNILEDVSEGSESSEGPRICGYIVE